LQEWQEERQCWSWRPGLDAIQRWRVGLCIMSCFYTNSFPELLTRLNLNILDNSFWVLCACWDHHLLQPKRNKRRSVVRVKVNQSQDLCCQPTKRLKIVWFIVQFKPTIKSTNKCIPLIAIPTEQVPSDFIQNTEVNNDRLFVACIKWHVCT
jgi:hypothetical protein